MKDIEGTDRDGGGQVGTWRSKRLVLADDQAGFSLHETTVYPGTTTKLWYKNHIEAVLCVEGTCELTDEETGEVRTNTPGDTYLLDKHDQHILRPITEFRVIGLFTNWCISGIDFTVAIMIPVNGRCDQWRAINLSVSRCRKLRCGLAATAVTAAAAAGGQQQQPQQILPCLWMSLAVCHLRVLFQTGLLARVI